MNPSFIHLRVHSAYSLAEGAVKIKDLVKICQKMAMPAVAVTDSCNLFGALEFSMAAADAGIQPIIGAILNISQDLPDDHVGLRPEPDKLVLLVQDEQGYTNLMRLISDAYTLSPHGMVPQVSKAHLAHYCQGLIALTAGTKGEIARHLLTGSIEQAEAALEFLATTFKDRLYIEIMRHGMIEEEQIESSLLDLAYQHQIPLVATNDVFFTTADMYEAHDALLCIDAGVVIATEDRRRITPHHYFKSAEEMAELFADLPEALENSVLIARRCHYRPLPRKPILPPFESPSGLSEAEELRLQASEGLDKRLINQVYSAEHTDEQKKEIRENYFERLYYEIGVIEKMGFPGYFLIVADFIKWAKNQGIPVGPGRGSGAGSLVAWSLTITDIDPIRFSLIFERFLNPERVSMPDFDVDFCQDRRDEVISYVRRKYGDEKVAQIITFGKLQARIVLRDVGRVLQLPYSQVDRISKLVPNNPANPINLKQALELEPALEEARRTDTTVEKLIDIGMKLEGLYRHASTHAAGVVIGDRPLCELVALYKEDRSELPATQFNMKYVEMAGLVKFDFLGLKTLTVIQKSCEMVRQKGIDLNISHIPLDDRKTLDLLTRIETVGVFQVESAGMRDVLKRMKPDRLEDLVALVALYRPGPMDDIPRYIACKNGEEEITYLHPELQPILEGTYGVMVYQEQVMQIAQVLGGYTLGAADLLRRAMGKKIKEEMDAQRALFTKGAVERGIEQDIARQIFDQMAKFAGYGFNKSHSAPYALLTYQTAYLKANYPLEFFAASMTYEMQNTDKLNIFRQDMQRAGYPLFSPNVNKSMVTFAVEGDGVRYALAAVKNVGEHGMEALVAERQSRGEFKDIHDFANRIDPKGLNKRQLENLIAAGAFDDIYHNRGELYANADEILKTAQLCQQEKNSHQASLFGATSNSIIPVNIRPCLDFDPLEKLQKEFEALGFFMSAHPLDIYGDSLARMGIVRSSELLNQSDGSSIKLAGVIIVKQERASKSGQKFAFLQLSDAHGVFEVAVFSEVFTRSRDFLTPGTAIHVSAIIRFDGDDFRINCQTIEPLEKMTQGSSQAITIHIDNRIKIPVFAAILKKIPEGPSRLYVKFIHSPEVCIKLTGFSSVALTAENRSKLLGMEGVRKIEG
ncbi:DNA polymerase III subunit alpha [Candidatus Odyssella thessalonicensis]|uniref:DNA polymerase III subunit alpha n=1 Tax=Candidatus Odyssella thessalonicensis TaxID=84647 RepID=UPI000225ABD6|nr:DNA polymerase III subunit alpha [Candidatus Odyssella thessalonicensis]